MTDPAPTPHVALVQARALIDTPDKWCQGHLFTRRGDQCCAVEALMRVAPGPEGDSVFFPARQLLDAAAGEPMLVYNDTHTHTEVIAVYDRAIERSAPA